MGVPLFEFRKKARIMKFFSLTSPAIKRLFGVLVLGVIGVLIWRVQSKPVPVAMAPVTKSGIVAETMGTGTLEARVKATVGSKIQGRLVEVLVEQNDRVQKGQLLAVLDDAELKGEVAVARAMLGTQRW